MQRSYIITLILLTLVGNGYAQKAYIEGGSIIDQFEYVQEKSSRWETYTMIPDPWFKVLKKNALDTLRVKNEEIVELKNSLTQKDIELNNSIKDLTATQNTLAETEAEKNSFNIFNIEMSKGFFLSLIGFIFIALLIITAGALLLFKKENSAINKNKTEHNQLLKEFEEYRQEVRIRQEQLVIQHHKEIQKLKGMG